MLRKVRKRSRRLLLSVLVIVDVFPAVPQPPAFRTIAELHVGVRDIGLPADSAFVESLLFSRERPCLFRHLSLSRLHPPPDVLTEEQEKIADRGGNEQPR